MACEESLSLDDLAVLVKKVVADQRLIRTAQNHVKKRSEKHTQEITESAARVTALIEFAKGTSDDLSHGPPLTSELVRAVADAIDADARPSPRYASASSKEGDFEMLRYCENVVKSMSFPIHSTEIEPLRTSLVPGTVVEWYERVGWRRT